MIGVAAVLLFSPAVGPAAADWGGSGFVQNMGQVSGGCRYYLNTPEYRLEVHPQELRIWLKEGEGYSGLKEAGVLDEPGLAHLAGYFLRVPLAVGPGQTVIEAAEPTDTKLRVIKGDRHCRQAGAFRRLNIQSAAWGEGLALIAEAGAVLFERHGSSGATARATVAPWLAAGREVRSRLAIFSPILDGQTRGCLVRTARGLKAGAEDRIFLQPQATPTLLWSTFVGGESEDFAKGVMACADGSLVLTGPTYSVQFPTTPGAYDTTLAYDADGYVAKLSSDGGTLLWATLIGGQSWDQLDGATLTANEEVVITGMTRSGDFPTTPGAYDEVENGAPPYDDIFVSRLSANGDSLVWSTLVGGTSQDWSYAVAEDESENLVVGGYSASTDFPVTAGAFQTVHAGAYWSADAVIVKLSGDGSSLLWGTFLGGGTASFPDDRILDLAVMPDGTIVAYGQTHNPDFPVTSGAFQTTLHGSADLFVSRISADGHELLWSTFLGGSNYEFSMDMTVSPSGAIILGGSTMSLDFPVTNGAFDRVPSEFYTGFVAQMANDGAHLIWSSFVGGQLRQTGMPCESYVWPVAVSDDGTVWAAGYTDCVDFPTTVDACDRSFGGVYDAFVFGLTPNGTSRVWATYLGGTSDEAVRAMQCDRHGRMILGVSAWSTTYGVTAGAYDTTHNSPGLSDVAVTLFRTRPVPVILASFSVQRQGQEAAIAWRLAELTDVASFEVWRAAGPGMSRVLVGVTEVDPSGSYVIIDSAPESGAAEYWLKAVSASGGADVWYGPAMLAGSPLPERLTLSAALPNPFNPRTTIRYSLPKSGRAKLVIYDVRGSRVATLVDADQSAGEQSVEWAGLGDGGTPMPSGVYFARLETLEGVRTVKVTLAK